MYRPGHRRGADRRRAGQLPGDRRVVFLRRVMEGGKLVLVLHVDGRPTLQHNVMLDRTGTLLGEGWDSCGECVALI